MSIEDRARAQGAKKAVRKEAKRLAARGDDVPPGGTP